MIRFVRFGLVGVANTVVGLTVITVLLAAGVGDYGANLCSYGAGLMLSFVLNRSWTFGVKGAVDRREAAAFLAAVGLSYLANLCVLGAMRGLGFRESLVGQGAAMLAYSTCFFVLARCYVFRPRVRAS